jgi:hypothetical protein
MQMGKPTHIKLEAVIFKGYLKRHEHLRTDLYMQWFYEIVMNVKSNFHV